MSRTWKHGHLMKRKPWNEYLDYWRFSHWLAHGCKWVRTWRNRQLRHRENQRLREGKILYQGDLAPHPVQQAPYDWW